MTCTVKGCPAPEHSDWPWLPDAREWSKVGSLYAAAPDMAHSLAGLVEAANQIASALHHLGCEIREREVAMGVVKGALIDVANAEKAYQQSVAAIDAAEAALKKAGGKP